MKVQSCNKGFISLILVVVTLSITACSGGGSPSDTGNGGSQSSQAIGGSGVKGPLANADVSVYKVDTTQSDLKGAVKGFKSMVAKAETIDILLDMHGESLSKQITQKVTLKRACGHTAIISITFNLYQVSTVA